MYSIGCLTPYRVEIGCIPYWIEISLLSVHLVYIKRSVYYIGMYNYLMRSGSVSNSHTIAYMMYDMAFSIHVHNGCTIMTYNTRAMTV